MNRHRESWLLRLIGWWELDQMLYVPMHPSQPLQSVTAVRIHGAEHHGDGRQRALDLKTRLAERGEGRGQIAVDSHRHALARAPRVPRHLSRSPGPSPSALTHRIIPLRHLRRPAPPPTHEATPGPRVGASTSPRPTNFSAAASGATDAVNAAHNALPRFPVA